MLVNAQRAYKRPNVSYGLQNNFQHPTCRMYIDTFDIGRICSNPEKKLRSASVVTKCSMYRFVLDHRKLLAWCQRSYHVYVVSHYWTIRTCCLLRPVVSNGIFFYTRFRIYTLPTCSHFHVGVTYLSRTKSGLVGPHRLIRSPDTCIGLPLYRKVEM